MARGVRWEHGAERRLARGGVEYNEEVNDICKFSIIGCIQLEEVGVHLRVRVYSYSLLVHFILV